MQLIQILIPALWTLIIVGCIQYVKNNKRFPVTFFKGLNHVRVEASPSLCWSKRKSLAVIIGYAFLAVMWLAFILLSTDIVGFPEKSKGAIYMVGAPTLLSIISFFAGYSSRLANNYATVDKIEFENWERLGYIERKGEKDYVDATDNNVLLHQFDDKQWIK